MEIFIFRGSHVMTAGISKIMILCTSDEYVPAVMMREPKWKDKLSIADKIGMLMEDSVWSVGKY